MSQALVPVGNTLMSLDNNQQTVRQMRLDAGLCPLHDDAFFPVSGGWVRCGRRDCGILGMRRADGGVDLAPGWRFLLNGDT